MRFSAVHKTCSYLMVATSLGALVMTDQLNPVISALIFLALVLSWFWEAPKIRPGQFLRVWNGLTIVMLLKTISDLMFGESVIISAIYFVTFLCINKLFNRTTSKDYLQLYVLSLLQMIAATALSTDLTYGVLFLAYIIFSTWTLIVFNLRREMESNFLLRFSDTQSGTPVETTRLLNSKRLVGPQFLLLTSGVSVVIFLGAALFFFLFPRVGFRLFNQSRPGISIAGFSDRVELGHFGTIKDNPTVVMRVEFKPPEDRAKLPPYWRGISFDTYDGKMWAKSRKRTQKSLPRRGNRYALSHREWPENQLVTQEVYLEPMETRILFGLQTLNSIEIPKTLDVDLPNRYRAIQRDQDGDIHYEQSDEIAFRYIARSRPPLISRDDLSLDLTTYRKRMNRYARTISGRFLQRPKALSDEVQNLALDVVGDAKTLGAAVDRVENYLKKNYRYTLKIGRDTNYAPLEDFLFRQRQGHCEYFATAMTMMLRSIGIGARLVNGFHGGQWNDFGQYMAVTQGNAHSWVEVHIPRQECENERCYWYDEWIWKDPTPSSGAPLASNTLWLKLKQYTDALRMRWYKYIIEYNLENQLAAIMSARNLFDSSQKTRRSKSKSQQRLSSNRTSIARWVGIALGVVLLFACVQMIRLRFLKNGRTHGGSGHRSREATQLIETLIATYSAHGFVKSPSMTIPEYVENLKAQGAPGQELIEHVVAQYHPARFGFQDEPLESIADLKAQLKMIRFTTE